MGRDLLEILYLNLHDGAEKCRKSFSHRFNRDLSGRFPDRGVENCHYTSLLNKMACLILVGIARSF
jgi:hypothetical protein